MMITRSQSLPYILTLLLLSTVCPSGGCGYHFRADGEPVGIKIVNLSIPLIESTSSSIGFESEFTRVIREEFVSHAKVPIVSTEMAQAVLTGRIFDIRTEPLTYDLQQQTVRGQHITHEVTRSRRLKIKMDIKLTDRTTEKVIWHERAMEEKASFIVGTDPLVNRYNQEQALRKIARQLAKRIYLKTMERF